MTTSDASKSAATTALGTAHGISAPVDFAVRARLPFPVVGIGASAGGVQALRAFFDTLPPVCGMAFVVVQHLPPEHESMLAQILARHTAMPVLQIEPGMAILPDHVYVIRPGHTATMPQGVFHLGEPVEKRGHRRPVDDFFRSLAAEQKENAIAIVLSGLGTNGTAGAQAIKAAGGLCIAQDPDTAEFPGMPTSLIQAGYADRVVRPEDLGALLLEYARQPYLEHDAPEGGARQLLDDRRHYNEVLAILRTRTRHDFRGYKQPTVLRRTQRRMGLAGLRQLRDYAARLREEPDEARALANDLLINVTGFFRDDSAWEALRTATVRPLVEAQEDHGSLRAWVSACASGEEAYSLAMLMAEEIERAGKHIDVKIFATDTADKSLALARAGLYPGGIEGDIDLGRLDRFFDRDEQSYRVKKEIRDMVVFARQDILIDPPFSRMDLCTCRNMLIYLEPDTQVRVISLLHFALREGGTLFLGNAETLGAAEELFEVLSKKWRIYRRTGAAQQAVVDPVRLRLPAARASAPEDNPQGLAAATAATPGVQRALLERFGPPTLVVDTHEHVVYFHGDTSPFLLLAGEPTSNLLDLVRARLRPIVRSALRQAVADRRAVTVSSSRTDTPQGPGHVRVTVEPLSVLRENDHYRVSFETRIEADPAPDETAALPDNVVSLSSAWSAAQATDVRLEEELHTLRHELQHTREAYEATTEELKASNEEVTSVNEELQSANEELETGKEELQSLNEELLTVNAQLQEKVNELEAAGNDRVNLLASTDIAVVFLDRELRIKQFTFAVDDLLELIPSDIGRPIAHLARKFDAGGDLVHAARAVLDRLVPAESEVRSHSGRWYLQRVLPYRTADDRIDGVVVAFIDISVRKRAEQAAEAAQARLQAVLEQLPAGVVVVEAPSGRLLLANRRAADLFGHPHPVPFTGAHWTAGYGAFGYFYPDGRRYPSEAWPLARTLATGETVTDEEIVVVSAAGDRRMTLSFNATPVRDAAGQVGTVVATFWDVTEQRRTAQVLRESEERLRLLVENARDYALLMLDAEGRIESWNIGAERLLGWSEAEAVGQPGAVIFTAEDRAAGVPQAELAEARQTGQAMDERLHQRKDGNTFWASGVLTAVRDAEGEARGFVKIMRDNTERRQAELRLHEALQASETLRAQAESASRAKDDFISTISHELRTPLNTMALRLRLLARGQASEQDRAESVGVLERAVAAQRQLIDDLLDTSRMATGKLRLELRDTHLAETIASAVETVRPVAADRGVRLEAELSPEVDVVRVDPDRIQQVVWNLLTNAVKFTPPGGRVALRMHRSRTGIEIVVTDTGIGIRRDFLPHVFDRFRQAETGTSRQHAGLGLGLAIARQLVELHHGTIEAASEGEGRGATFTVCLPLAAHGGEAHGGEAHGGEAHGQPAWLGGLELLLVEDEATAREATRLLLEEHGAGVRAVDSAQAARDQVALRRPDAIVADIGMPGEDGYALIGSLRRLEQAQGQGRLPALALTAFAGAESRRRALKAGFDEHLPKPVDLDRLVRCIAHLVHPAPDAPATPAEPSDRPEPSTPPPEPGPAP